MLKKRVIPIVLLDGFSVVKTINFDIRRNLGSPITVARTYNTRNVDELILLDIDASKQQRAIDAFTIKDIASELFMPLTVGGGIRTIENVRQALVMGADKVSINSEALRNPNFIREASQIFGSQCIVGSVDIITLDGHYYVYNQGKALKKIEPIKWCRQLVELGVGELLINSVTLDGTMQGIDANLAQLIAGNVSIPVIYTGGVSSVDDCAQLGQTEIAGIGASSIFHFTSTTPIECKEQMHKAGISVRL